MTMDVVNGATGPTASVALTIADDLPVAPTSSTHSIAVADQHGDAGATTPLSTATSSSAGPHPGQAPGCTLRTDATCRDGRDEPAIPRTGSSRSCRPWRAERLWRGISSCCWTSAGPWTGRPLEHLKAVVTTLIDSLDDDDRLEMVAFSSEQVRYRAEPVHATEAERRKARAWIEGLRANGGTELISAIDEALRPLRAGRPAAGRRRDRRADRIRSRRRSGRFETACRRDRASTPWVWDRRRTGRSSARRPGQVAAWRS